MNVGLMTYRYYCCFISYPIVVFIFANHFIYFFSPWPEKWDLVLNKKYQSTLNLCSPMPMFPVTEKINVLLTAASMPDIHKQQNK